MPLKGLAGKTDGIVAQNLERGGEWLSLEQGVSPTFICPPASYFLGSMVDWKDVACGARPTWNPGPAQL